MNIRLLDKKDAQSYRQLRLKALRTDPQVFLSTFAFESQKYLSTFEWELQGCIKIPVEGYYGYFDQEQLIAYLQLSKTGMPKQNHLIFLYNLYVDPEYRKQKIGYGFMSNIIGQIREKDPQIEQIRLTHIDKNQAAHQLYLSLGFKVEAIKKNVIKHNDDYADEVEMVLNLKK